MSQAQQYEKLAFIYDRLMLHVNYKHWAEYVINLFQYANLRVNEILDISMGTGKFLSHMNRFGYRCFGSDISYPMILQAKRYNTDFNRKFIVTDARQMAYSSAKFDAVLFLYDSFNYLLTFEELEKLFGEVNRVLKTGGVFIFDVITDFLCLTYYSNFNENENWADSGYIRHSFYDKINKIQNNDFKIMIGDEIYSEQHQQRVYSGKDLAKLVTKYNFGLAARLDDFTYLTANKNSERIHYVCVKK